ncbi:hypothetical protein OF83DRAFT_1088832 [Amylostereum chailletii]|nr:hypothetical protein OF83DRAFT_1088832 [Amylostereum chailletii]
MSRLSAMLDPAFWITCCTDPDAGSLFQTRTASLPAIPASSGASDNITFDRTSTSGIKVSGWWLDMNEPSSFCDGFCGTGMDLNTRRSSWASRATSSPTIQRDTTLLFGCPAGT